MLEAPIISCCLGCWKVLGTKIPGTSPRRTLVHSHPTGGGKGTLAGEGSQVEAFPMSLLTQGQGPFPQASPQSQGNTLSPAAEWGVCMLKCHSQPSVS